MKYLFDNTIFICNYTDEKIIILNFYFLYHIYYFSPALLFDNN